MMGRLVTVTARYHKNKVCHSEGTGRYMKRLTYLVVDLPRPRAGWYVGERNLRTGDIQPGSYEDPAIFYGKGNLKAHAVVFWPTMAPVLVPHGCMSLLAQEADKPYPPSGGPDIRKILADDYRRSPHLYPRDAKGRFTGDVPPPKTT